MEYYHILFLLLFISTCREAQYCNPESVATAPGNWNQGIAGSPRNVTATELVKEKAVDFAMFGIYRGNN